MIRNARLTPPLLPEKSVDAFICAKRTSARDVQPRSPGRESFNAGWLMPQHCADIRCAGATDASSLKYPPPQVHHRRNKAELAINENHPARHIHECRCFDGVNRLRIGFKSCRAYWGSDIGSSLYSWCPLTEVKTQFWSVRVQSDCCRNGEWQVRTALRIAATPRPA
jgi:hypothetical protein